MQKALISFDLQADFGVLKKPDVNEGLQLTYNMLHKPALLGILGAIAGLEGYQRRGELPQYYKALEDIPVAIAPLEGAHEKGNFAKFVLKYTNTVGYANEDGNLIVTEQVLIKPAYRCFLLLDMDDPVQQKIKSNIEAGEAEFVPYIGKNECTAWWDPATVQQYEISDFVPQKDFQIDSVFLKQITVTGQKVSNTLSFAMLEASNNTYAYFERLPQKFYLGDTTNDRKPLKFVQYALEEYAFTTWKLKKDSVISGLYQIRSPQNTAFVIQLI